MATVIDERIVSMQFDNSRFEKNVSSTMSTLDRFKRALKLDSASKGLEEVESAAKKVNLSNLGSAVETVNAKFSALQVVGVTALANITNSAVDAGKRIVKALTIDPVTTGFKEYETKINAVQVLKANTRGKNDMDDIYKALDALNDYADKTIYNYTQMVDNAAKFTAQGLDVYQATDAIKGLANLAGASGASASDMARATYQMSQALGGVIRKIDWNSLRNANMASETLKNVIKDIAEARGIDVSGMIKDKGTFEDTLEKGWLSGEIFTEAMNIYSNVYSESELAAKGFTEEQIKNFKEIAKIAEEATTEVKTFSQLYDVLKETAQSGWTRTWELIVGDFDAAKKLLTPLNDVVGGIINSMSDFRNNLLEIALNFSKPWDAILEKLGKVNKVTSAIKDTAGTLEYFQDVVWRVWHGEFNNHGDPLDRRDLLEAAGYNDSVVQYLVNLGGISGKKEYHEITIDDIRAAHEKFGLTMETTTEETEELVIALNDLSDAQLRDAGLTESEIALYHALKDEADKLGISVEDLANKMADTEGGTDGRSLLIGAFGNIGNLLMGIGETAKAAWQEIFNPPGVEVLAVRLYSIIDSFHEFTKKLRVTETVLDENGEEVKVFTELGGKLTRILKGLFAVLDIIRIVIGGPLTIALRIVKELLGVFGFTIVDVAAFLGDMLVGIRDTIDGLLDFSGIFEKIATPIRNAYDEFQKWIDSLKESENLPQDIARGIADGFGRALTAVKNFIKAIPEFFKSIPDLVSSLFDGSVELPDWMRYISIVGETIAELAKIAFAKVKEFLSAKGFEEISADSISGLVIGLKNGAVKVWNAAVEIAKQVLTSICEFLGIESPSRELMAVGEFTTEGFVVGLQNGAAAVWKTIKGLFGKVVEWVGQLDFGNVVAAIVGIGTLKAANTAANALNSLATPLEGLGEVFASTSVLILKLGTPIKRVVNGFARIENSVAFNITAEGIKTLALSLLMLAASVALLTLCDPAELWNAVGVIAALAVILAVLALAMSKIGAASASFNFKDGLNVQGMTMSLIGIGAAILLMAAAVKMVGQLNPEKAKQGFLGLAGMVVALGVVVAAFIIFSKVSSAANFAAIGSVCLGIAGALLILAFTAKIAGKLKDDEMVQAAKFLAGFVVFVGLLTGIGALGGKAISGLGSMMMGLSVSLLLMVAVVKLAAGITEEELLRGGNFILGFTVFIAALSAIGKLGGRAIDGVGKMMLSLSVALLLMIAAIKLIGFLTPGELLLGAAVITAFTIMIALLIKSVMKNGTQAPKVALIILAFSVAIAMMAAIAVVCSMISTEGLIKGVTAVGLLSLMMMGLVKATKGATNIMGTVIAIAAAIAVLVAAVAVLGMIDPDKLVVATAAVSILMGMLTLLVSVAGKAQKAMGAMVALSAVLLITAGALYILADLPADQTIASAIALGGLLLIMSGVLVILSLIGSKAKDAMMGALALGVLGVAMAVLGLVLAMMTALNVQDAIPNAIALSVLCTVLAALLIPLSVIGELITLTGGGALLGIVGLLAMAVPLVAFVGILALMAGIQNGIENAKALTELMTVIGNVLIAVSLVAPLAIVGVTAISKMIELMVILGLLAVAIGALLTEFPQIETLLDTGIPILERLAMSLGSVLGNFIAGFAGGVLNILPMFGIALSGFMIGVQPFIVGMKMVDDSVLTGAAILSGAIVALSIADFIAAITTLGGCGLVSLGTQLSAFIIAAMPFLTTASRINPAAINGIKTIAETVLILTAADVVQGLTSWFTGGSSLENFANQFPVLGTGLRKFLDSVGTFSDAELSTVSIAAEAVKTLAEASSEIPNTGGWLGQIVGENDLGKFADQFPVLGTGLRKFLDTIGTFSDAELSTVSAASEAVKTLAEASSEIPNTGGWLGQIVGENDLGKFADQFPSLGSGLRGFVDSVGTFSDAELSTVSIAAEAVKALATASSEIPNSGGWLGQIVGENGLDNFADQFPTLGSGLRDFLDKVGTFNDAEVSTVTAAAEAVKALATASSEIPNSGGWISKIVGENNLEDFADQFPALGSGLRDFLDNVGTFSEAELSTFNAAITAIGAITQMANVDFGKASSNISKVNENLPSLGSSLSDFCSNMPAYTDSVSASNSLRALISAVKSISDVDTGCISDFADSLKKLGGDAVNKFISAFTSATAKTDLKKAATNLAGEAVSGAKSKAYGTLNTMESAGKYLGDGLIKGIKSKKTEVYNAGKELGKTAVEGEMAGQDSASPSKATIQAGNWFGEGLIIGINNMGSAVYNAGKELGADAVGGLAKSVRAISDSIDTDMDLQPTIRPVIDLSDVKTGVNAIGGMFSGVQGIGVQSNIGAVNLAMNNKLQNRSENNIVSAINKLNEGLANNRGDTYNVNGINVSEGTDAADAIHTLVRVIKMEGRS